MSQAAVVFGGPSPEHDVSVLTGLQAARALVQAGVDVQPIYWGKNAGFYAVDAGLEAADFADGAPRSARELRLLACPDGGFVVAKGGIMGRERTLELSAAVICCHGGPGEDGTLQAAFDLAGLAYTGPTVAGAALGMDKLAFGGVLDAVGVAHLPRWVLDPDAPGVAPGGAGPFIVKPRFGGSSIGIEVVADWETAASYARSSVHLRRGAVVEPYRADAFDLNVAVRTWPQVQLSAIERPLRSPGSAEILGYGDKYLGGEGMLSAPRELPARIEAAFEDLLRRTALATASAVQARGVARIDFLVADDELLVNEINTIPGSLARYLWVDPSPVEFTRLLTDMLDEAARRPSRRYDATGADGSALRAAGSIAGKLG